MKKEKVRGAHKMSKEWEKKRTEKKSLRVGEWIENEKGQKLTNDTRITEEKAMNWSQPSQDKSEEKKKQTSKTGKPGKTKTTLQLKPIWIDIDQKERRNGEIPQGKNTKDHHVVEGNEG